MQHLTRVLGNKCIFPLQDEVQSHCSILGRLRVVRPVVYCCKAAIHAILGQRPVLPSQSFTVTMSVYAVQ